MLANLVLFFKSMYELTPEYYIWEFKMNKQKAE